MNNTTKWIIGLGAAAAVVGGVILLVKKASGNGGGGGGGGGGVYSAQLSLSNYESPVNSGTRQFITATALLTCTNLPSSFSGNRMPTSIRLKNGNITGKVSSDAITIGQPYDIIIRLTNDGGELLPSATYQIEFYTNFMSEVYKATGLNVTINRG